MKSLFLLILTLFSAAPANAQSSQPQTLKNQLSEVSATDIFTPADGRFSIALPGGSGAYERKVVMRKPFTFETYTWQFRSIDIFILRITKAAGIKFTAADRRAVLRQARSEITRGGREKPISDYPIKLGKFTGRQLITYPPYESKRPENLAHILIGDSEAFIVKAVYRQDYEINQLAFRKIASFRIEGEPGPLTVDIPNKLPQFPEAKRAGTDAKDEGLKGAVQTVTEEHEYFSGKSSGRDKFYELHFSRSGNLEHMIFFNNMLPHEITFYGYLKGVRVQRDDFLIHYRFKYPPGTNVVTEHKAKNGDPRYERRYDYIYDDRGRLWKVTAFDNAGVWQHLDIYNYTGNTVTRNTYGADLKPDLKHFTEFDDKGNVIKEDLLSGDGSSSIFSSIYTYESFDSTGNWTKRAVKSTVSSTSIVESIQYRTISYYK